MNNIIYLLGILSLAAIGYIAVKSYSNTTVDEFNKKALLTVILTSYFSTAKDILKVKDEHQKMISIDLNHILINIVSITDNLKYDYYKREFASLYTKYVQDAIIQIRNKIKTKDGKEVVAFELEKYKNTLEDNLKKKTLLSLKLQQNKIMYQAFLEKIINTNGLSETDFLIDMTKRLSITLDNFGKIFSELKDRDTGLIYESDKMIYKNLDNILWDNKKLSNELFIISNELSIIKDINLNRV